MVVSPGSVEKSVPTPNTTIGDHPLTIDLDKSPQNIFR
jgi:hypothetical protein